MYGLSDIMIPLRAVTGLKLTASYFSKHSGLYLIGRPLYAVSSVWNTPSYPPKWFNLDIISFMP